VEEAASTQQLDGRAILDGPRVTAYVGKLAERHDRNPEAATQ